MSRSFAILIREAREKTPNPCRPGKCMTQEQAAEALGIHIATFRFYEQDKRTPHPLIRREIFRFWPDLANTV